MIGHRAEHEVLHTLFSGSDGYFSRANVNCGTSLQNISIFSMCDFLLACSVLLINEHETTSFISTPGPIHSWKALLFIFIIYLLLHTYHKHKH